MAVDGRGGIRKEIYHRGGGDATTELVVFALLIFRWRSMVEVAEER